jgi:hypothetical protein
MFLNVLCEDCIDKTVICFSAWIEESQIKPYFIFKDQLIKSNKSRAFKDALQAIEEYIKTSGDVSIKKLRFFKLPYFPAYKTHRPVRRALIFSLEILEKIMMNVF